MVKGDTQIIMDALEEANEYGTGSYDRRQHEKLLEAIERMKMIQSGVIFQGSMAYNPHYYKIVERHPYSSLKLVSIFLKKLGFMN